MTYLQNRLNQYETYTYNIRLYMVNPSDLNRLDGAIADGSAVKIADNASNATYNINNLEQIFTVGHNQVREALANNFQMTVQEPNGVTLLNTIKLVSLQLGIQNHIHAGYLIAIDFHGRLSDGRARKFEQTFYYPVIIKSLDFKVDEGGATYNINLVENSSTGYQYLNNVIKEQVTITAQTVGEFVDRLQDKFNQSIFNAWAANPTAGRYPDQYRFEFDESTESWRNWRFQVLDEPFEVSGTNFVGLPGTDPSLQVTVNNGSNLTTIFGQVLQLTSEYKKILANQSGFGEQFMRNEPSEQVSRTLDSFPVFFKVISNVEYGQYDELAGQYSKTIVYKIKAYTVTDEVLDSIAYQSSITNPGVQSRRVSNLIANNFMRKRYDYYYTGRNTEVLEFDMQFDFAYFYVTAYGDGYFGDPEVQSPQFAKDRNEVIARLREVTEARQELANAQQNLNKTQASDNPSSFSVREDLIRVDTALQDFNEIFEANITFLRDTVGLSPSDINYQMRFVQDVVNDQDQLTSDNDTRSGALKFGAVKANLENASDLVKIELGIRGDPYWMGVPNSLLNQQRNVDELADYEAGAPSFFLQVNLPNSEEDVDGRRKPQPDYQLSGVYTVRSVINRFSGGQFVQYLSAVRDLGTNVSTVWESLAGDQTVIQGLDRARIQGDTRDLAQEQENARPNNTGNN